MSWFSKLLVMVLPACKTASQISYRHDPTAELHKSWNLADPALQPFTRDGVVISPRPVPLDYENTAIKLLFAAPSARSVAVGAATLQGAGGSRALSGDQTAAVDKAASSPGVYKGEVTLGTLTGVELETLSGGANLQLIVTFPDAPAAELRFELTRHTDTYVVSR